MDVSADSETDAFEDTVQELSKNPECRLGFIEFDDQGELWRMHNTDGGTTQLSVVLKDLKKEVEKGPIRVVVYIHGWNNSANHANEQSGNLSKFKMMLAQLGASSNTPVYGIYVAWRGSTLPFATYVDLWDRDATARRIGGPTMLAALTSISSTVHPDPSNFGTDGNSVIMIGHSFGGKILTQVTAHHLGSEIGRALGERESHITPLADTVIVINSATNGQEMRQVHELMKVHRITYRRNDIDVPLFVTIASESDFLVRYFLPVYQRLNRDFLAYPDRGGHVANKTESDALYRAMGHNSNSLNFEFTGTPRDLTPVAWSDNEPIHNSVIYNSRNGRKADNTGLDLWMRTSKDPSSGTTYKLKPLGGDQVGYQSPHWGFTVPSFVVAAHNGLWQPNFVGLISALEGMTLQRTSAKGAVSGPKLEIQRPLSKIPTE